MFLGKASKSPNAGSDAERNPDCHGDAERISYSNGRGFSNVKPNPDRKPHAHGHSNAHCDSDANSYTESIGKPDADQNTDCDTKPHADQLINENAWLTPSPLNNYMRGIERRPVKTLKAIWPVDQGSGYSTNAFLVRLRLPMPSKTISTGYAASLFQTS